MVREFKQATTVIEGLSHLDVTVPTLEERKLRLREVEAYPESHSSKAYI